jgi:predicted kinase
VSRGRVQEVIITSGIPGAGKSTWIRCNTDPYMTEVFSADGFFIDRMGVYRFDPSRLAQAHARCLRDFTERLIQLSSADTEICPVTLVVDNTNITPWEIAPYYSLASAWEVPVRIIRILADPLRAHRRNVHGVLPEKVLEMAERLASCSLPSFWNVTVLGENPSAGNREP